MESKITIEIHDDGQPYLYIKFNPSPDLRDKVLGMFLTSTGALDPENKGKPVGLSLSVLDINQKTFDCIALIEPAAYQPS